MTVQEIETAVTKLGQRELRKFREWFDEFDAAAWDEQFERDAQSDRLARVAEEALRDYKDGKCTER